MMEPPAVRVQLPSGPAFTPAFIEAVQKYALRRGFSDDGTVRFVSVIEPSLAAVNSADPTAIELIVVDTHGAVQTEVHGKEPANSIASDAVTTLESSATAVGEVHEIAVDAAEARVRFTIDID